MTSMFNWAINKLFLYRLDKNNLEYPNDLEKGSRGP